MSDIASSLEQEFATSSQAERESLVAELKRVEAKGRGQLDIRPHAIAMPILLGFMGAMFMLVAVGNPEMAVLGRLGFFVASVVFVVGSAWAMFGPRKARFTLCEDGVRVNDTLLPWASIADYHVTEHSRNGITTHTSVEFKYVEGYAPPELGLLYLFGNNVRHRKTGLSTTRLTLHAGARGMNCEKLAQRIGEFSAAAQARDELKRLLAS